LAELAGLGDATKVKAVQLHAKQEETGDRDVA
jgi:hypothetical protein